MEQKSDDRRAMHAMIYPAVLLLGLQVGSVASSRDTMAMTIGEMTERLNRASDSAYGRSVLNQASTTALLTIRQLKTIRDGADRELAVIAQHYIRSLKESLK